MSEIYVDNITVNTDASLCPHTNIAGYAFYIKAIDRVYKHSGILKKQVRTSQMAELYAIGNACAALVAMGYTAKHLTINSDCETIFNNIINSRQKEFVQVRKIIKLITKNYTLCHVKAHKRPGTPREFVNEWCDKEARNQMRNKRDTI
jgi:ribonuclease HI